MTDLIHLVLGFLEGLSLFLSPCILPILPILLSASLDKERLRPYGIILGFAGAFTLFTLFSRQLVLSFNFDPNIIRQVSFVLLFLFGLILLSSKLSNLFAGWTQGFSTLGDRANREIHTSSSFLTGLLIGSCIGLVWVPCSGPILAAVLVQSIQQKTTLAGALTIFAFAIGAGLPMLLIALFGNRLAGKLTFFKQHGEWVRKATGAIIIATVLITSWDSLLPAHAASESSQARIIDGVANPYPAPAFSGLTHWMNSKPLSLSELKGKVVLIDFWTYSCINCVRTLPHITAWDAKYRKNGLVIIGIHAPEFAFEQKAENVSRALQKHGIHYPVALDNNLQTWQNFHNQYWPAHYLIDRTGKIVYTHFGEGNYEKTEANIRYLLGTRASSAIPRDSAVRMSARQTPETYLGAERESNFAGHGELQSGKAVNYQFPASLPQDHWALQGNWRVMPQFIRAEKTGASLRLNFFAKNVYLVLGSANNKPIPVRLFLNGKPTGKSLTVSHHALYTLVDLRSARSGLLELQSGAPGLEAYAFTFGG